MEKTKLTVYLQHEGDRPRCAGELEMVDGQITGFTVADNYVLRAEPHLLHQLISGDTDAA